MKTCKVYVIIIAILLSMIMLNWQICAAASADSGITIDGKIALSAMIALVDGHIEKMVDSLELLALTGEVKSLDWEKMKPLLAKVQQNDVPSTVWFARADGSYCTVDKGAVDKNLKDREYFPKVMAGEKVIGALVVSKSTGKKGMVVAAPISVDGKVSGMLGATIFLDGLSTTIKQDMQLPDDVIFYAITDQANTTLNWRTDLIFEDPTKQGNPSLKEAIEYMLSRKEGMVEYTFTDKKRKLIFQTSPLTGWWVALGIVED